MLIGVDSAPNTPGSVTVVRRLRIKAEELIISPAILRVIVWANPNFSF